MVLFLSENEAKKLFRSKYAKSITVCSYDRSVKKCSDPEVKMDYVYPDGFVQVMDLDELCDAKEKNLITPNEFFLAVKQLGTLLDIIYNGHLEDFAKPLLDVISKN